MKSWIWILLFVPQFVNAHPVSYEGGYSLMADMSEPLQNYSLIYSPKWWLGTGVVVETVDQQRIYSSAQLGVLVHRWNWEEAQANVYVLGGAGYYSERIEGMVVDDGGFGRLGMQVDYETRKVYANIRYVERRSWDGYKALDNLVDAAMGFSPYVGNYGDLHTWLILRYMDGRKMESSMISPTVRFFYRNYLWEVGMSTRGVAQLNFMIHL